MILGHAKRQFDRNSRLFAKSQHRWLRFHSDIVLNQKLFMNPIEETGPPIKSPNERAWIDSYRLWKREIRKKNCAHINAIRQYWTTLLDWQSLSHFLSPQWIEIHIERITNKIVGMVNMTGCYCCCCCFSVYYLFGCFDGKTKTQTIFCVNLLFRENSRRNQ